MVARSLNSVNGRSVNVDEVALQRLAKSVLEARGERSQREFAQLIGVAQSTVQSWENARNTPSLENLEKIASMRGQLPEEFVAFLYGRSMGQSLPLEEQISRMSSKQVSNLMNAIAARLATD